MTRKKKFGPANDLQEKLGFTNGSGEETVARKL